MAGHISTKTIWYLLYSGRCAVLTITFRDNAGRSPAHRKGTDLVLFVVHPVATGRLQSTLADRVVVQYPDGWLSGGAPGNCPSTQKTSVHPLDTKVHTPKYRFSFYVNPKKLRVSMPHFVVH